MAEANEPPINAAARERREELGLTLASGELLAVDRVEPHGPWDDTLAFVFVFVGGVLSAAAIDALRITDDELAGFRFCTPGEAAESLRPYVWQRAAQALEAIASGRARYLTAAKLRRNVRTARVRPCPEAASPWRPRRNAVLPASALGGQKPVTAGRRSADLTGPHV
jgi:ADP-ribose pyrophosphatase YjhB (NUDIX family)